MGDLPAVVQDATVSWRDGETRSDWGGGRWHRAVVRSGCGPGRDGQGPWPGIEAVCPHPGYFPLADWPPRFFPCLPCRCHRPTCYPRLLCRPTPRPPPPTSLPAAHHLGTLDARTHGVVHLASSVSLGIGFAPWRAAMPLVRRRRVFHRATRPARRLFMAVGASVVAAKDKLGGTDPPRRRRAPSRRECGRAWPLRRAGRPLWVCVSPVGGHRRRGGDDRARAGAGAKRSAVRAAAAAAAAATARRRGGGVAPLVQRRRSPCGGRPPPRVGHAGGTRPSRPHLWRRGWRRGWRRARRRRGGGGCNPRLGGERGGGRGGGGDGERTFTLLALAAAVAAAAAAVAAAVVLAEGAARPPTRRPSPWAVAA